MLGTACPKCITINTPSRACRKSRAQQSKRNMATSEELRRELDNTCRRIDELREYHHEIETVLSAVHGRFKWLRAPGAYLLKKDVTRQIQLLKWRNNVVRNCYLAVKKNEEREQQKPGSRVGLTDGCSAGTPSAGTREPETAR